MALSLKLPPLKHLKECFFYHHRTGELYWKHRPLRHFANAQAWATWNRRYARCVAGHVFANRRMVSVDKQLIAAHRIIWKLMTGKNPPRSIDHKDRNGTNNRWNNLRSANKSQQNWNTDRRVDNTSGHKGVSRARGKKWRANIRIQNVQRHLGTFQTIKDAAMAYDTAARSLHGEFYAGGAR
jgi:hypothetical protein